MVLRSLRMFMSCLRGTVCLLAHLCSACATQCTVPISLASAFHVSQGNSTMFDAFFCKSLRQSPNASVSRAAVNMPSAYMNLIAQLLQPQFQLPCACRRRTARSQRKPRERRVLQQGLHQVGLTSQTGAWLRLHALPATPTRPSPANLEAHSDEKPCLLDVLLRCIVYM